MTIKEKIERLKNPKCASDYGISITSNELFTCEEGIDFIKSVLIHNVGDNRECHHCGKSFIPDDRTSWESLKLFKIIDGGKDDS